MPVLYGSIFVDKALISLHEMNHKKFKQIHANRDENFCDEFYVA